MLNLRKFFTGLCQNFLFKSKEKFQWNRSLFYGVIFCLIFFHAPLSSQNLSQEVGFKLLDNQKSVKIPFKKINNLIVVPVMLENKLPLHFILDTGVRTAILTDRVYSDLLDINYIRKYTIRGAGNSKVVEAYIASDVSLHLPGIEGNGFSIFVLEEDYLKLSSQLGVEVDGILGYEFFNRFVVKIDYSNDILTVYNPGVYKPSRAYKKMKLEIEDTKPYLVAKIKERSGSKKKSLRLMLDTGASHALLLHQDAENKRFNLPEKTIFGSLGRGLGGEVQGHVGRIQSLEFKDFCFEQVLTSFPMDSSYGHASDWDDRGGTLGGSLLNRFNVVLDYPGEAVYFKKNSGYRNPFVFSKTGLVIVAEGKELNSFKIQEVREGSPADMAGIKAGDKLLRINGQNAQFFTLSTILDLFDKREGKKMRLLMKRGNEEYKTFFRLQDII